MSTKFRQCVFLAFGGGSRVSGPPSSGVDARRRRHGFQDCGPGSERILDLLYMVVSVGI